MNHLANAVKCLAGTLQKMANDRGEYLAIDQTSYGQVSATLVMRDYEVKDDDGVLTTLKSADWIFQACDLDVRTPQPGDQWTLDETGDTYHAMLLGNRPCFEAHDAGGQMIVVHMKKVASA